MNFITVLSARKMRPNKLYLVIMLTLIAFFLSFGAVNAAELTILHINDHHSHLKPDSP